MDLASLVSEMDGKISEQVDNYLNVVEKSVPATITEDLPKVEEKKPEEKPKKEEIEEKKPEPVEEKTEPLMKIPTLEEMKEEEEKQEKPKKKKLVRKVVKKKAEVANNVLDVFDA